MASERIEGATPAGGDYAEIFYTDDAGNPAEKESATMCIIRECKKDGTIVNETFGLCG